MSNADVGAEPSVFRSEAESPGCRTCARSLVSSKPSARHAADMGFRAISSRCSRTSARRASSIFRRHGVGVVQQTLPNGKRRCCWASRSQHPRHEGEFCGESGRRVESEAASPASAAAPPPATPCSHPARTADGRCGPKIQSREPPGPPAMDAHHREAFSKGGPLATPIGGVFRPSASRMPSCGLRMVDALSVRLRICISTGSMRRLYVPERPINVQKQLFLQASACNLALDEVPAAGGGTSPPRRPPRTPSLPPSRSCLFCRSAAARILSQTACSNGPILAKQVITARRCSPVLRGPAPAGGRIGTGSDTGIYHADAPLHNVPTGWIARPFTDWSKTPFARPVADTSSSDDSTHIHSCSPASRMADSQLNSCRNLAGPSCSSFRQQPVESLGSVSADTGGGTSEWLSCR